MLRLTDRGMNQEQIEPIWANIDDEYFVRESAANIAWHTEAISRHEGQDSLVLIEDTTENIAEGATRSRAYSQVET